MSTSSPVFSFASAWDRTSVYLPVVLMGFLALFAWWLAHNTPTYIPPESGKPARHAADYFMRNFTLKNYDTQGVLKSEVSGTYLKHYEDTDVLEIEEGRIVSYKEGRLTTATAKRVLSNGDGSQVQLLGNAVVVREAVRDGQGKTLPRMEFKSEFLHAFLNEERIASHKPVIILRGSDVFSGDQLAYSQLDHVAQLQGRARATLHPSTRP